MKECISCGSKSFCATSGSLFVEDEAQLYSELCAIQGTNTSSLTLHNWVGNGIGSAIHFFAISATFSFAVERKIVPLSVNLESSDVLEYFTGDLWKHGCEGQQFDCFLSDFEPSLQKPDLALLAPLDLLEIKLRNNETNPYDDKLFSYEGYELAQNKNTVLEKKGWNLQWFVPPKYEHKGPLWFRSHLLNFYIQPNANFKNRLAKVINNLGLNFAEPILAMHIRRGDKLSDNGMKDAHFIPVSKYLEAAEQIRRIHSPTLRQIFVSTEDQTALNQLRRLNQEKYSFTISFTNHSRQLDMVSSNTNSTSVLSIKQRINLGLDEGIEQTDIAFLNLFIARDCQYFVGTLSSNWGRLVLELMYARQSKWPVHMSLDDEWIA